MMLRVRMNDVESENVLRVRNEDAEKGKEKATENQRIA